jgi:heme exporter protein C
MARSHIPTLVLLLVAAVLFTGLTFVALHDDGDHSRAPGYYGPRDTHGMKDAGRIFYFHVPSAMSALLAFTVTLVCSVAFLRTRRAVWDRWASSAAEIGLLFSTVVLVTGSIWARAAWGAWWVWDEPRLTTSLILWFVYFGYLLVRAYARDREEAARFSAVIGIVGYVLMPLVYVAGNFGAIHPRPKQFGMDPEIRQVFFVGMATVPLVALLLLVLRVRLGRLQERLTACRERMEDRLP